MSGEAVAYHLRQNKHVDRQLFIEVLSHVDRVIPVKECLYASFGGVYFEDFKLMHTVFGSEKMLSIEEIEWVRVRQEHNCPYGCIRCEQLESAQLIDQLDTWRETFAAPNVICWFDYASPKRRTQLEEFRALIGRLEANDVIKITMNANPATYGSFEEEVQKERSKEENTLAPVALRDNFRFKAMTEDLGDMLPNDLKVSVVSKAGFPSLLLGASRQVAARAIAERPGFVFLPLASFSYADSEHTMLTCTGILLREPDVEAFKAKSGLQDFAFNGLEWNLHAINVPLLSAREKSRLDHTYGKNTPEDIAAELGFQFDKSSVKSLSMLKDYFRFHRFYPHFHRIQY
jgi:hypothetical protein